jgi:hypothetical protein
MKATFVLLCLLILPISALAQMPSPTVQLGEMKKLSYMVGQWHGSGWVEQAGQRETFSGMETVQSKLNGLALLVEGKFGSQVGGKRSPSMKRSPCSLMMKNLRPIAFAPIWQTVSPGIRSPNSSRAAGNGVSSFRAPRYATLSRSTKRTSGSRSARYRWTEERPGDRISR